MCGRLQSRCAAERRLKLLDEQQDISLYKVVEFCLVSRGLTPDVTQSAPVKRHNGQPDGGDML